MAKQFWLYQDMHFGSVHFSDKPVDRQDLQLINHVIEISSLEETAPLADYEKVEDKITSIKSYCEEHRTFMWAAKILGIINGTDFRGEPT